VGRESHRSRGFLAPRFVGVHLLAIALVAIAAWLGSWQYAAWQAERAAQSRSFEDVAPVPLPDVFGPDDPFPGRDSGRPVRVAGEWLPDATLVVSGRARAAGKPANGYWIVTPVAVGGADGPAFPVVLGWTADPADARRAPAGRAEVVALLQPPEATGEPDDDPTDNVLPTLRIAEFVQRLDRDAYGGFGIAAEPTEGLVAVPTDPKAQPDWSTGLRNLFYAFEWWFFGGFAVFAWWRYLRDERAEVRDG
jgi:surfeit locus 1 family protein